VEPAPTRATSGEPSHPDAILTPTRGKNPDDQPDDHADERSGLIQTDKLGFGHQKRAQDIAHRLGLGGKVIIDKGSVPEWME
jgi:hypothetical protein